MIKSCVTIALVPQIKTGPWIYWENLETSITKAAQLGFEGIELFTASADAIDPATLTTLLEQSGLKLAAVGTGAGKVIQGFTLTDPDPAIRQQATTFIADMIAFGAQFQALAIIGSMQGNIVAGVEREQAMEWLAEGLNFLGEAAVAREVPLIYEPLNRYETNLLNSLSDGAEFLNSLKTRNVKLLADLFHMNIEESSLTESIRQNESSIGHIHFADSNRRPVGLGHTAVAEIAKTLQEINYNGYVSAEALPWPNPDEAAQQTIKAFHKFFKN
ncbi:sugar phosphate isomerase/epimerase family protein [Adhaeribacter pallidiroseus]|uniref:D-psicose 3-epimerase n=1 Tax=Adhaeribacter pallidiroseus TaxID=2072847 RepID=A0A369QJW1_9BACT|nr:sugar phosphate isomerase/epimerase family protein [Adhaeribacter pallidiroseus]RDC65223.1 D-psicose 3-epimerase [Adhaeribacter pallidiroseus]